MASDTAQCAKHPERASVETCARCGAFLCTKCLSDPVERLCVECDLLRFEVLTARTHERRSLLLALGGLAATAAGAVLVWGSIEVTETETRALTRGVGIGLGVAVLGAVVLLGAGASWVRRRFPRGAPPRERFSAHQSASSRFPSLPDDELRARLASTARPFSVCLDCRVVMPLHAAVDRCPRCKSAAACLTVTTDQDVQTAAAGLNL